MNFFEYFSRKKNNSASIAKERLQIIVAHERNKLKQPDYLPALQRDIMEVLRKYVDIDMTQVEVQLENNGNCAVLELNVTLPE
ncbi:MAG TPA: cell division topological specificity factor MinE [Cellvibrionaceae bacterium]|jgi:cell division topological specificity factor